MPEAAKPPFEIQEGVSLRAFTTLKAGGAAESFAEVRSADELADAASFAQSKKLRATYLGWGSNVLPSDDGVPGLVLLNSARRIRVAKTGEIEADTGCGFQELFLKTAQAGLTGLEFAVGIPGTLGGALVSNAGAYRSNIADHITEIEVVSEGERKWVQPNYMHFSYRDSILRRKSPPALALIRVRLKLASGEPKDIYGRAREYQRQRISKQPPPASAGSFFKNVQDSALAEALPGLPEPLKKSGVVPSGFLIEAVGLKGHRMGGAILGPRHANFIVNVGGASAFEIRRLAEFAKARVFERFGATMEEEVLYLGDWSRFSGAA